jgi:hypothetical protein
MRILLKCPTRSRPQKVIATLGAYLHLATRKDLIGVAVSCDQDDTSMTRNLVQEELRRRLASAAWHRLFFSANRSKIEACNANMDEIDYPWDIVILVSDDMIPQVSGWDDVIRNHMLARFPDTNGILWCNDGYQGDKLNTLCIFGRRMYEEFGHIYHPDYKSLFCDTELTDRCNGDLKPRCFYIPYCIIRHEHPGTGYAQNNDALYAHNQTYWIPDMLTYIRRKAYAYDWSILVPTMPGRETGLRNLITSIREKVERIAPELRLDIRIDFDNRESSIGAKRQRLLQSAQGKYVSFIDDDDDITDAYVEDLLATIRGGFHVMRLRGDMKGHTFVHSTGVKITDFMATKDDPPVFQRPPNHLNPMLTDIAKLISFKNAVHGEDLDWTLSLYRSGFLQTEYRGTDDTRVHYIYNLGDRIVHKETITMQQTMNYETMLNLIFTPAGTAVGVHTEPKKSGLRLTSRGFVSR